jgi:hypothetical protein
MGQQEEENYLLNDSKDKSEDNEDQQIDQLKREADEKLRQVESLEH